MFHTKTILTLGVRRFIMVFLITLFFIISPIIILYTAGYTYDTKNHQIKTRGTLSITVVPKKASITLNGIPLPEKTPLRLKHRSPGSYHIIIKKDGYKPWETNSIIESNKTTYLHNIQLFKDQPFTLKIDVEKNQIYPSHNGSHIIIKKDKAETQEGLLFTPQSINPVTLFRVTTKNTPIIMWSPFNTHTALIHETKNGTDVQIIDPKNIDKKRTWHTTTTPQIQWAKQSGNPTIFIKEKSQITKFSDNSKIIHTEIASDIWYVDEKEHVWEYDNQKKTLIKTDTDSNQDEQYILNEIITNIIDVFDTHVIVQTANATKSIPRKKENTIQTISAKNTTYNPIDDTWIIWSEHEIWKIKNTGEVVLLNRTGEKIKEVTIIDKYEGLVVLTDKGLFAFDPRHNVKIALTQTPFTDIQKVRVDNKKRRIIFFGKTTEKQGIFELQF